MKNEGRPDLDQPHDRIGRLEPRVKGASGTPQTQDSSPLTVVHRFASGLVGFRTRPRPIRPRSHPIAGEHVDFGSASTTSHDMIASSSATRTIAVGIISHPAASWAYLLPTSAPNSVIAPGRRGDPQDVAAQMRSG